MGKPWRPKLVDASFPGLPRPSPLRVSVSQVSPFCLIGTLVIGLRAHPESWMTSFNPLHHFIDEVQGSGPSSARGHGASSGHSPARPAAPGSCKKPAPFSAPQLPLRAHFTMGTTQKSLSLLWPRLSVLSDLLGSDKRSHSLQAVRRNWVGSGGIGKYLKSDGAPSHRGQLAGPDSQSLQGRSEHKKGSRFRLRVL